VRAPELIRQFLEANWQRVTGTMIAVAAVAVAVILR
jgi:hypothetical protein